MAWKFPSEVKKETIISSLDDNELIFYHDHLHVFWSMFSKGADFGWTFQDIYSKHREVVFEMIKREVRHLNPIDSLDDIKLSLNDSEIDEIIKVVSKSPKKKKK